MTSGIAVIGAAEANADTTQTLVASDGFARADGPGWGPAGTGGAYRLTGSDDTFSVSNQKGLVNDLQPGRSAEATLLDVSAEDTIVQGIVTVPSVDADSLNLYSAVEAREQDNGSGYRGTLRMTPNGGLLLSVSRIGSSGAKLDYVQLDQTVSAGQSMNVQLQVTGTNPVTVSARAWSVGASAPGWQVEATDTSSSRITDAGGVGVWDYVSSASVPTTVVHDSLQAWELTDAVSAPAPAPVPSTTAKIYRNATFDGMSLGGINPLDFISELGGNIKSLGAYDDMTIVSDGRGGRAVRTTLKAGTIHNSNGGDSGDNLFITLPGTYDKACIEYDIRFDSNFDWSLGGKLPGLEGVAPGVSPSTPSGGNDTTLGWSGRMMWLTPRSYSWAGPTNMAVSYMYHPGQSDQYGDDVRWNESFVAGRWHTVKQCYKMNTVGRADGVLQAWMDGAQVVNDNAFTYRTRSDVHINYLMFSLFRGGHTSDWAGSRDGYVDIDNMVISDI